MNSCSCKQDMIFYPLLDYLLRSTFFPGYIPMCTSYIWLLKIEFLKLQQLICQPNISLRLNAQYCWNKMTIVFVNFSRSSWGEFMGEKVRQVLARVSSLFVGTRGPPSWAFYNQQTWVHSFGRRIWIIQNTSFLSLLECYKDTLSAFNDISARWLSVITVTRFVRPQVYVPPRKKIVCRPNQRPIGLNILLCRADREY